MGLHHTIVSQQVEAVLRGILPQEELVFQVLLQLKGLSEDKQTEVELPEVQEAVTEAEVMEEMVRNI